MLRHLPRTLLKASTPPKYVAAAGGSVLWTPHSLTGDISHQFLPSALSNLQRVHFSNFASRRLKSTSPKQKDASTETSTSSEADSEEANQKSPTIKPEHFQIKPARQTPSSNLVVQDEDEKSKRRYEKEDPPEEDRHKYWRQRPERSINKALMRTDYFDNMKGRDKDNFSFAIELFREGDVHLRGHVEFIYVALKEMKRFGVHRDLESYKKILDVFPKGRMIQANMFQVEFMHYPKHQQCAVDVLEQMEHYGVIPDSETHQLLTNTFGQWSFPMRKVMRMSYWMPKFKHLSPWKLPEEMPDNALELAKLAVERMTSVDVTTKISIYNCSDLEDAYDLTWIVSGQSTQQQKLIEELPPNKPIYVEGAFRIWLKNVCMNYFILRGEPKPKRKEMTKDEEDDVGNLHTIFEDEFIDKALDTQTSTVHEQEDGIILGVCCTGTSSRDSIVSWIRFLEETNPRLGRDISVLFTLKSPIGPTDDIEILSLRDIEELKKLGKGTDQFTGSESNQLGLDPGVPDLRQVGVWTESESKFVNWPHNFHAPDSVSMKNKLENQKALDELEADAKQEPQRIGDDGNAKQIK